MPIDGPPRTLPLDGVVVRECRAVAVVPTVAWQPQPRGTKEKLAEGAIGRGSGRVGLGGGGGSEEGSTNGGRRLWTGVGQGQMGRDV